MRLVLDWDGTVTERDSLWLALEEFGDREIFERVEGELVAGRITFRDVMELEFASVSAPLAEVTAYLRETVILRPGFAELVRLVRADRLLRETRLWAVRQA